MIEAMSSYQQFFGIKPMGEHRAYAHSLLDPLCAACAHCGGSGVVDGDAPGTWRHCAACEGLGKVWTGSLEAVDAARAMVAARYPNGVVSTSLPMPTSPFMAYDIGAGRMVDLRNVQSDAPTEHTDETPQHDDASDERSEDGDEEPLTLRERMQQAARRRPRRSKAVCAILDADAVNVLRLIATIDDEQLAKALQKLQASSDRTAASLLYEQFSANHDAQAAFVSGLWSDEDVAEALKEEDGWLWLHCLEISVGDADVLYYPFLWDGHAMMGWFGVFADRVAVKTAISLQGTLTDELGSFWDGIATPLEARRKRNRPSVWERRQRVIDNARAAFERKLADVHDREIRDLCERLLPLIDLPERDFSRINDHYALRDALLERQYDHCGTSFVEGVWSPKAIERAIEREQFCWAHLYAFPLGDGSELVAVVWSDSEGDGKVGGLFASRGDAVRVLKAWGGIDAEMIGDWAD